MFLFLNSCSKVPSGNLEKLLSAQCAFFFFSFVSANDFILVICAVLAKSLLELPVNDGYFELQFNQAH